jgi:DNA-binding NtrC family response regulator
MQPVRVLVIDDEMDFMETLVSRLKRRTFEASGVTNGEEALKVMRKRHFDLVILDIKLSGQMDGIDTLKEIKKIQPMAEVILLTGHASLETSNEGMSLGAFDYLLKPVKLDVLLEKMNQALEKRIQR